VNSANHPLLKTTPPSTNQDDATSHSFLTKDHNTVTKTVVAKQDIHSLPQSTNTQDHNACRRKTTNTNKNVHSANTFASAAGTTAERSAAPHHENNTSPFSKPLSSDTIKNNPNNNKKNSFVRLNMKNSADACRGSAENKKMRNWQQNSKYSKYNKNNFNNNKD
jgi:hypothetical protein